MDQEVLGENVYDIELSDWISPKLQKMLKLYFIKN
jgi:hypothetical protein